jgi:hypothetical protein
MSNCLAWNLCQQQVDVSILESLPGYKLDDLPILLLRAVRAIVYPGISARLQARGPAYPGTFASSKSNCLAWNLCQATARGPAYPGTFASSKSNCLAWNLCQAGVEGLPILELLPAVRAIVISGTSAGWCIKGLPILELLPAVRAIA